MAKQTRKPAAKKAPAKKRASSARKNAAVKQEEGMIPSELSISVNFDTYPAGKYTHEDCGLSEDQVLAMYRNMLLQRRFEERFSASLAARDAGGPAIVQQQCLQRLAARSEAFRATNGSRHFFIFTDSRGPCCLDGKYKDVDFLRHHIIGCAGRHTCPLVATPGLPARRSG